MTGPLDPGREMTHGDDEVWTESEWTPETVDEDTPVEVLEWIAAKLKRDP